MEKNVKLFGAVAFIALLVIGGGFFAATVPAGAVTMTASVETPQLALDLEHLCNPVCYECTGSGCTPVCIC